MVYQLNGRCFEPINNFLGIILHTPLSRFECSSRPQCSLNSCHYGWSHQWFYRHRSAYTNRKHLRRSTRRERSITSRHHRWFPQSCHRRRPACANHKDCRVQHAGIVPLVFHVWVILVLYVFIGWMVDSQNADSFDPFIPFNVFCVLLMTIFST